MMTNVALPPMGMTSQQRRDLRCCRPSQGAGVWPYAPCIIFVDFLHLAVPCWKSSSIIPGMCCRLCMWMSMRWRIIARSLD